MVSCDYSPVDRRRKGKSAVLSSLICRLSSFVRACADVSNRYFDMISFSKGSLMCVGCKCMYAQSWGKGLYSTNRVGTDFFDYNNDIAEPTQSSMEKFPSLNFYIIYYIAFHTSSPRLPIQLTFDHIYKTAKYNTAAIYSATLTWFSLFSLEPSLVFSCQILDVIKKHFAMEMNRLYYTHTFFSAVAILHCTYYTAYSILSCIYYVFSPSTPTFCIPPKIQCLIKLKSATLLLPATFHIQPSTKCNLPCSLC